MWVGSRFTVAKQVIAVSLGDFHHGPTTTNQPEFWCSKSYDTSGSSLLYTGVVRVMCNHPLTQAIGL